MYDRRIGSRELTLGISGKLYKQNLMLYDHQTESLWPQILQQAVTGPLTGSKLHALPSINTTWQDWKSKYPASRVLSEKTGYNRDYSYDPYGGLFLNEEVIGVEAGGQIRAYPFSELKKVSNKLTDSLGDQTITVHYDPANRTAVAMDSKGNLLPSIVMIKRAWLEFHPKSSVFQLQAKR